MAKMIVERIRCISDEILRYFIEIPKWVYVKKGHVTERKERVEVVKVAQSLQNIKNPKFSKFSNLTLYTSIWLQIYRRF